MASRKSPNRVARGGGSEAQPTVPASLSTLSLVPSRTLSPPTILQVLQDAKRADATTSADYIGTRGIATVADWRAARPDTIQRINLSTVVPVRSLAAIKAASEAWAASEAALRATTIAAKPPPETVPLPPPSRPAGISDTQRAALSRPLLEGPVSMTEYVGMGRHFIVFGDNHVHRTTCPAPVHKPDTALKKAPLPSPPASDEKRGGGQRSSPTGGGGGGGGTEPRPEPDVTPVRPKNAASPPKKSAVKRGRDEGGEAKRGGGEAKTEVAETKGSGSFAPPTAQQSIEIGRWMHSVVTEQGAEGHATDMFLESDYARRVEPGERREDVRNNELAGREKKSGSYLEDVVRLFGACLDPDKRAAGRCTYTASGGRFHNVDLRAQAFASRPSESARRYDALISVAFGLEAIERAEFAQDEQRAADDASNGDPEIRLAAMRERAAKLRSDFSRFIQTFDIGRGPGAVAFLAEQLRPSPWILRKLGKELGAVADVRVRRVITETLPVDDAAIDFEALAKTLFEAYVAAQAGDSLESRYFALRPLIKLHTNVLHRSDQYLAARTLRDWPEPSSSSSSSLSSTGGRDVRSRPITRGIVYMGDAHARNLGRVFANLAFLGMRRVNRSVSDTPGVDFQCVATGGFARPYFSEPRRPARPTPSPSSVFGRR